MSSKKYYLNLLPLELKLKICSFLNTYDILELSRILPDFEFCMLEKKLSRVANLYKEYRMKACDLVVIFKGPRSEFITYLNINCVYWVPSAELKKCLMNLKSLECLYAVDTKMTLNNCNFFEQLLNLKRIALSFDNSMSSEVFNHFPRTITHLCLHINKGSPETISRLSYLIHTLGNLEELWIIDLTSTLTECISMRILSMLPKSVKRHTFFVQSIPNIALINQLYIFNSIITFRNKCRGHEMIFEKGDKTQIRDIYSSWTFEDEAWNTIINYLKIDLPFCPFDANLLIKKKADLSNIKFRELNLCHSSVHCSKLFKPAIQQLLMEPNVEFLKKLSINLCILEINITDGNGLTQEPLFKKNRRESRISSKNDESSCIVNVVLNSCPYLEELELWECRSQLANLSLNSIKKFKRLRKLTLDGIPTHISGIFLIDICKCCINLESLRIKTDKQNSTMNNSICSALAHANNLKDFRYENAYIPIDKIFESINNISKSAMERLVIKCKSVETFSVVPFKNFFKNNTKLRFLCIIIKEMPKANIRNISRALTEYKDSLEKIFLITQDETLIINRPSIPNIHKYEMLHFHSQICNLDLFNGFSEIN